MDIYRYVWFVSVIFVATSHQYIRDGYSDGMSE